MKQFGKYYAVLVGLYIAAHATGLGTTLKDGAAGVGTITKSLEGRD